MNFKPYSKLAKSLAPLLIGLLAATGCASASNRASAGSGDDHALSPGAVSGARPPAIVHRGAGLSTAGRVPLLLVFEGTNGTPKAMESLTGFDSLADRYGFVVAYLGSTTSQYPWAPAYDPHYLSYVSGEIASLTSSENIDPTRVYTTGFSSGGIAALRSACELPGKVAATAVVSYVMGPHICRSAPQPIAELTIMGSQDRFPVAPSSASKASGDQTASRWLAMDGCSGQPITSYSGSAREQLWSHCYAGTAVGLDVVQGGTHAWPSASGHYGAPAGTPDASFAASQAIWDFLSAHSAAPLTGSVKLTSLRTRKSGQRRLLVATFRLDVAIVTVETLVSRHHRKLSAKRYRLSPGRAVKATFTVPPAEPAGRYTIHFSFTDPYGRAFTLTRAVRVPAPPKH